jgi:alkanesulfonate monooxygenase
MISELPALTNSTGRGYAVDVFSSVPQSWGADSDFLEKLVRVARWSEQAGCRGILVYTDNRSIDPWLVAHVILQKTSSLCPLVAIQPVYMQPYTVAKLISTLGFLYRRRLYLNMVAGGFTTDLQALCDNTPHDLRYERLLEYTTIIQQLLAGKCVSYTGKFYQAKNLVLNPPLPPELYPGIFMSGSSEAGMLTAQALGATAIEYPKPTEQYSPSLPRGNAGIRVGIIATETTDRAWEIARHRFPGDPKGRVAHKLAMKFSDSHWHKQLSAMEHDDTTPTGRYWLWPFKNYNTFCPYLVGNYDEVSDELSKYICAGFTNFVLDIPAEEEDLHSTSIVFSKAADKATVVLQALAEQRQRTATEA